MAVTKVRSSLEAGLAPAPGTTHSSGDDGHLAIEVKGGVTEADDFKSAPSFKRAATNAAMLRSVEAKNQIAVQFTDVCGFVPMLFGAPAGKAGQEAPKDRQILYNISGAVSPGEVLALMGPSGSGKSSLLAILGARSTARTTGTITFNGSALSKPLKRKLGYVQQDDLLFAELTVYETLYYAAMLRLPRNWSYEDKIARVEMVIEGLGLGRCRDTIIGNHMMRGVSGGERKRVSIGHELLINPSVIFLDEPTSGLDSTTALRLMHTLRTLASGGRTIITSIHQPSSRLYKQMDKLLLLSEGHAMYYGAASLAAGWFELQGQACPFGTNIADHILDLANGDVAPTQAEAENAKEDAAHAAHQRLVAAFENRTVGLTSMGIQAADLAALRGDAKDQAALSANAVCPTLPPALSTRASTDAGSSGEARWGASWVDQVKYLTVRSVKTRRFGALSWQKFAQMLVVAVLAGLFWWQVGGRRTLSEQRALDIGGLLFFIELFMAFSALFAALFTFPMEFQLLVKERQSGMYRLSSYYLARTLADLPMDCLVPTLFTWVLYFMAGLRLDAGAFFCNWFSVILVVLVAQSVGLFIGATVINPQNGQTIATIFMLATMLVGGYYVRTIPVWISWLKYTSFIYWGWNLLLKIEFRHRGYPCSLIYDATGQRFPVGARCDVADGGVFEINVNEVVTKEVCILIAMLIFMRVLVYYALSWKTTFRKRK